MNNCSRSASLRYLKKFTPGRTRTARLKMKRDTIRNLAYTLPMSTTLKSIPATVFEDGSVTLSEPVSLSAPVAAMVTIVIEEDDRLPNRVTREAMEEPLEGLERFKNIDALKADLAK